MKYFSADCVANAYMGFQGSMTNKSWGYLALMKECNQVISTSTPYEIDLSNVANFLEQSFNFGENKKHFDGIKKLYVLYSSRWKEYFQNQGNTLPNIYHVAVWAFRSRAFEDDFNENLLISTFVNEFNIPMETLEMCFDTSIKTLNFETSLYSETDLKILLEKNGVDTSKDKIDAEKKGIVANPGEISRGPFIQPLYAGLEITDYVVILQSNFSAIYNKEFSYNANKIILSKDELVDKYKELVTSQYSTAGNAIFMASYGYAVMQLKLKAADIYNRATELYPEHSAKFRAQELNHAFKMYSYFLIHPELMHLPGIATNPFSIKHEKIKDSSPLLPYLTAIRTKPFLLLAGISGTGKSRIVRKLAQATNNIDFAADYDGEERWKKHNPTNFCLIQVKPNWHNSMDVVGFKSNIGGAHYEFTPFIEFIAKAWHYPDTPFFLCLDEMNLAPVEEYFAEFLSAIESRSINENGEYETDPIIKPFREFGEEVAIEMIQHLLGEKMENIDDDRQLSHVGWRFLNKGLSLPKNLIVMGTVNMDETTFSFSRKVLDRAMSIEMNEVNYDAFLTGETEEDVPLLTNCNQLLVERPINAQIVKADIEADKIIDYLKQVNALLEGTPFKLGYRAANEAFLYVSASKMFGSDDFGSALDKFTVMKILSRIEGDDSKLKTKSGKDLLPALLELLTNQFGEDSNSISIQKLTEMNEILVRDHFVSFWG